VKTTPDSVRLTGLKQTGDTLTLEGVAQSNASVATYMNNLDKSLSLTHSDLQKTEAKGNDKRNRFEFGLTVKLRKPESENPQDAGSGGNVVPPKVGSLPAGGGTTPTPPVPKAANSGGKP